MEKDLKWIKKHYGEQMMHLCRENFQRILEVEGVLPMLLKEYFPANRELAQDIISQGKEDEFKSYIFSLVDVEKKEVEVKVNKTAKELLDEAGYILYPECKTEDEIQAFKKYFAPGERLCTFNGGRLERCRVWFAVKKDVDKIRREDFKNPDRQDEYGTSVISIQFTRGDNSTLSIKNRYNHAVNNPDNTFNSNLDNIIPGLSDAFYRDYGVRDTVGNSEFELKGYVSVGGKYYKYNYEINNVYYCPTNVIIDVFKVKKLPPHQMLVDYFIFDFKNNTISLYDKTLTDDFINQTRNIEKIVYENNTITLKKKDGSVINIGIDDNRRITSISYKNLTECGDGFLQYNSTIEQLDLPNLAVCGKDFLYFNTGLTALNLPALERCGSSFLRQNEKIGELKTPRLKSCENAFLYYNNTLTSIELLNLVACGNDFLNENRKIERVSLPKLERCENKFMFKNCSLTELSLPSMIKCGEYFLHGCENLNKLSMPKLRSCEYGFLGKNLGLYSVELPALKVCGANFLFDNTSLTEINLPSLTECGECFMYRNQRVSTVNMDSLVICGSDFLHNNICVRKLSLPGLVVCGDSFMYKNDALIELNLPKLESCGKRAFFCNPNFNKQSLLTRNSLALEVEGDGQSNSQSNPTENITRPL